ncbi:hypothetical protein PYCCODRAFT_660959 [Trametes coccinea BRFM310]|uniref:Uncharacterized protein n=1 Tax=Trametes coccinea (strain BRFM310) TaxID=1353009 RepID=A0A1Y2IHU5_TRAC3|nr:hypothetical protein PYCCODRAFT_660959 [Trametes coccinea BRFM310]
MRCRCGEEPRRRSRTIRADTPQDVSWISRDPVRLGAIAAGSQWQMRPSNGRQQEPKYCRCACGEHSHRSTAEVQNQNRCRQSRQESQLSEQSADLPVQYWCAVAKLRVSQSCRRVEYAGSEPCVTPRRVVGRGAGRGLEREPGRSATGSASTQ